MKVAAALLGLALGCGAARQPLLDRSGDERDDGAGVLARAAYQLVLDGSAGSDDAPPVELPAHEFGGVSYAAWTPPDWHVKQAPRAAAYVVTTDSLAGEIDGVVTWAGASPRLPAPCGGLRLGADRGVRGALVYIEHVATGRAFPSYSHAADVGGTLIAGACGFSPAVQVIAPAPGELAIFGAARAAHLVVARAGADPATVELAAGARVAIDVPAGVTEIRSDDAAARAWVVGLQTPYSTLTDDDGRFRIDGLAAGVYDVTIFHAPATPGGAPIIAHRVAKIGASMAPVKLNVALR